LPAGRGPRRCGILRGVPLRLARVAALLVSISVVALVVARSSAAGCAGAALDIQGEERSDDQQANPGAPSSPDPGGQSPRPGASAGAEPSDDEDSGFMGGAKAPSGNWARPRGKRSPAPPAAQAPAEQR
jgi:hypothetical protein